MEARSLGNIGKQIARLGVSEAWSWTVTSVTHWPSLSEGSSASPHSIISQKTDSKHEPTGVMCARVNVPVCLHGGQRRTSVSPVVMCHLVPGDRVSQDRGARLAVRKPQASCLCILTALGVEVHEQPCPAFCTDATNLTSDPGSAHQVSGVHSYPPRHLPSPPGTFSVQTKIEVYNTSSFAVIISTEITKT